MANYKRKIALFLTNTILCGTRTWSFPLKNKLFNWAGYEVGEGTRIVGPVFITTKLTIGEDTWIGRNFSANGNGHVKIGSRCDVATDVSFYTGGHEIGDSMRRAGVGVNTEIVVNDGCWICASSKFLPGIKVDSGTVVAAGAVVSNDIEKNVLVGGVPAKVIKRLNDE